MDQITSQIVELPDQRYPFRVVIKRGEKIAVEVDASTAAEAADLAKRLVFQLRRLERDNGT